MIRQPTPREVAYNWHAAALAGLAPQTDDDPQCGWFKRPLVKGGPLVPARIWLDQDIDPETGELMDDERLQCEVNNETADVEQQWSWLNARPIPESEFLYLTATISWAESYAPDEPLANPRERVDWSKVPTPTF